MGTVRAIYLADAAAAPPVAVESARAVAGRGLEGDRYHEGAGTFFEPGKDGQDLTLIEAEAFIALRDESGVELAWSDARRNLVAEGMDLNALVGRRFRVGAVECVGRRLAEPCAHLARLTEPEVLRGLVHRGGLRADIVVGGEISVGDAVVAVDG